MARKKTKRKKAKRKKTKRKKVARRAPKRAKRRKKRARAANAAPKRRRAAPKRRRAAPKRKRAAPKRKRARARNPLYRGKGGKFRGRPGKSRKRVTVAGRSPRTGRRTNPAANRMRYPMVRRPGMRYRNPLYNAVAGRRSLGAAAMAKSLIREDALKDIALVTGGFVAGAVLPTLIVKGFNKVGIMTGAGGMVAQVGIGIGASAVAGVSVGVLMKDRSAGIKVAAGGIAGVLGALIVQQIDRYLPPLGMSGLGQNAEQAVRQAVEAEIRKNLGMGGTSGVGDFLTEARVEAELGGLGQGDVESGAAVFGDFPTVEAVESAPPVEGFGLAGAETPTDMAESMETFGYTDG